MRSVNGDSKGFKLHSSRVQVILIHPWNAGKEIWGNKGKPAFLIVDLSSPLTNLLLAKASSGISEGKELESLTFTALEPLNLIAYWFFDCSTNTVKKKSYFHSLHLTVTCQRPDR